MRIFGGIFIPLAIVIALVWPRYFFIGLGGVGVSGFTILTLVLAAVSVALLIGSRNVARMFAAGLARAWIVLAGAALFFGWCMFSSYTGVSPATSSGITFQRILFGPSWIFIGAVVFCHDEVRARFPAILAAIGLVASTAGVAEFVSQRPLLDLVGLTQFSTMDALTERQISFASSEAGYLRTKSLFAHPIVYGQVMAALAPFGLHLVLTANRRSKVVGVALLAAAPFAIVSSGSASPVIVAVVGILAYLAAFMLDIHRPLRIAGLLALAIFSAGVTPLAIDAGNRALNSTEEAGSTFYRVVQLQQMEVALESRPILGYGAGQATNYAAVEGRNEVWTIDSYWIVLAVEAGYGGLVMFAVMLLAIIMVSAPLIFGEPNITDRSLAAALASFIIGTMAGLTVLAIDDALALCYLFVGFMVAERGRQYLYADRMRREVMNIQFDTTFSDRPSVQAIARSNV